MTMSASEREAWQLYWSGDSLDERPPRTSSPQQGSLPTIRAQRADMPLRWRQSCPFGTLGYLLVLIASLWVIPTSAVFIDFQNCLSQSYQNDVPLQLQFDPLYMDAVFNTTDPSHNLHITVWGNVTGSGPEILVLLPPADNKTYWSSNETNLGGKIEDNPTPDGANKLTTLFSKVNVLTYEPWSQTVEFCNQLINASCPLSPSFTANA
jgi:ML-like domain